MVSAGSPAPAVQFRGGGTVEPFSFQTEEADRLQQAQRAHRITSAVYSGDSNDTATWLIAPEVSQTSSGCTSCKNAGQVGGVGQITHNAVKFRVAAVRI